MPVLSLRRRARVVVVGVLTVLAVALLAPGAHAHDVLIASDPADGQTLSQSPTTITLTFNNEPLAVGSAAVIIDAAGATVAEQEGTTQGTDVHFELGTELDSGSYEVRWRVASGDGHPIDGVIAFTVDGPAGDGAEPTTPPTGQATAGAPAVTATPTTTDPEWVPPTAGPEQLSGLAGLPLWLKIAVGLAALASVAGLIVLAVRRMRGDRV